MHLICLSSSSCQSDCVIFSQIKQQLLDLLRSTPKSTVLLVLDGCSGILGVSRIAKSSPPLVRAWKNPTTLSHVELGLGSTLAALGKYKLDTSLSKIMS